MTNATEHSLPEMVQSAVQIQSSAPGKQDYKAVKLKKVFFVSHLKRQCGCDRRVSLALYFTLSDISRILCVTFSFWCVLEAFGKPKQMGNRERDVLSSWRPLGGPTHSCCYSVTRHEQGFLSTRWRLAVVTVRNCVHSFLLKTVFLYIK